MRSLIVRRYAYTLVLPRDITDYRTKDLAHLTSLIIPRHPYVIRFFNEGLRAESKTSLSSSSNTRWKERFPRDSFIKRSRFHEEIGYRSKSLLYFLSLFRRKASHGRERKRMITAEHRSRAWNIQWRLFREQEHGKRNRRSAGSHDRFPRLSVGIYRADPLGHLINVSNPRARRRDYTVLDPETWSNR